MVIPYDETLINSIRDHLISRGQTISVAGSVTSGHLQAARSFADNDLQFYQGGITAYNAGQKTRHLQVEPIHALTCDCVSEQTAVEMARGSNQLFLSEYAIGITGYATPQPEDGIHDSLHSSPSPAARTSCGLPACCHMKNTPWTCRSTLPTRR